MNSRAWLSSNGFWDRVITGFSHEIFTNPYLPDFLAVVCFPGTEIQLAIASAGAPDRTERSPDAGGILRPLLMCAICEKSENLVRENPY